MKVVINRCFGGFGLSNQAFELILNRKGIEFDRVESKFKFKQEDYEYFKKGHVGDYDHVLCYYDMFRDNRSDPDLVAVVQELGEAANGWASDLKVIDIPDDVEWFIVEYDGSEHVAEKHRKWYE